MKQKEKKQENVKNAMAIGKSKLYDFPEKEFNLIACFNCQNLFNSLKIKIDEITTCPICKSKIKIIQNG